MSGQACAHCDLPLGAAARSRVAGGPAFCCFGCRLARDLSQPIGAGEPGATTLVLRSGLGLFLTLNIMVFSWLFYGRELFGGGRPLAAGESLFHELFAYLLMFLATAVVVTLGLPLIAESLARSELRQGRLGADADLLILLGVGAAYALSVVNTLTGKGALYFDTTAVLLSLVTLGRTLEARAKRSATASGRALLGALPRRVEVERAGELLEIEPAELAPGDLLRVRAGEVVAADGRVARGRSHVDEASLRGESRPRAVGPSDRLLGGAVNIDGELWLVAEQVGAERAIARLAELLDSARLSRPPIQRLADRVAAVFVPGAIALAACVFAWHAAQGAATRGLLDALSVLLISCPCALGFAAPLAIWVALERAAARGILIDSALTLERAAGIERVFFDKTGTLSQPELELGLVVLAPGVSEDEALGLGARIEAASLHPIARALVREARARGLKLEAPADVLSLPGLGMQAVLDGRRLWLGSARLVARRGLAPLAEGDQSDEAATASLSVHLLDAERVLARFELAEELRGDARDCVVRLQAMGLAVSVLTGDAPGPAARIASALGVPVEASLLPEEKLERLERAKRSARVAMVGDGVNDAPVLAAADVGFAMASASDLARRAGSVRLVADRLDRVPLTLAIARDTLRRIRMSLAWGFGYNSIGLGLAACGLLTPVFSAVAMLVSSLTILKLAAGAGAGPLATADAEPQPESAPLGARLAVTAASALRAEP